MPRSNQGGRNNNPTGRNQYSDWGVMELARERPFAAAAAAAGAAAAGLFLWSKRAQISNQLSSLSDQIGEWTDNSGSGDQFGGTPRPGREIKIAGAWGGHRRDAAMRMAGGLQLKLARGRAIEQPGLQHAVLDQRHARASDALAVERP